MLHRELGLNAGGWYLEVFDEANDKIGRWYGTRQECEACPTKDVELHQRQEPSGVDAFDLACERRWD